jgi:hypothetical protein
VANDQEPFINDEPPPFLPDCPQFIDMKPYLSVESAIGGIEMCSICSALVIMGYRQNHIDWHLKLQNSLETQLL